MTIPRLNPRQLEIGDRFRYNSRGPYEVTQKDVGHDIRRVVTRIVGKGYGDAVITLETFRVIYQADVIVDLDTWIARKLK